MSLRTRTLLVIGVILIAALTAFYIVIQTVFLDGFASLEEQDVQRNLDRTYNAIENDLTALAITVRDWAYWDDTYNYALGNNDAYVEANLYDDVFLSFGMNIVLFLDSDLRVLFGRGYDTEAQEAVPVPPSLWAYIHTDDLLVSGLHITPDDVDPPVTRGILLLREGPLMVASAPILPSSSEGPAAGVMIWGKYLDQAVAEHLTTLVGLPLSFYPVDAASVPADVVTAARDLNSAARTVRIIDNQTISGYLLFDDLYGAPAVIGRIEMPRTIYQSGRTTISYYVVFLIAGGTFFSAGLLLVLERLVLARLARLSEKVNQIAESGSLDARVAVSGRDELTTLGDYINKMLSALQRSQLEMQHTNESLEKRVNERTAQLSQKNRQLQDEIKEREKIQVELTAARDQALESLRLKTQILANVSHDARTPLNAISGYTEMLQEGIYGPLNEQQQGALQRILGSTHDLLTFINNLLDSARLEARTIQPMYKKFQVRNALAAVEGTTTLRAKEKGLELIFTTDEDVPDYLCSDEQRIKQIITNLTVNAIKFTDQGSVLVRAFMPDDSHFGIIVKDTGKGIAPELRQRIFEAFWQVDGSPTRRNNSGVGLGLAIVHALVQLLDGQVKLESEQGAGSEFTIILPLITEESVDTHDHTLRLSDRG